MVCCSEETFPGVQARISQNLSFLATKYEKRRVCGYFAQHYCNWT